MMDSPLLHRALLALAVLGWAVAFTGFVHARLFASDVAPPRAVMSAQTFSELAAFSAGFLLVLVAFAGSILALLASSQHSATVAIAAAVSGVYAVPVAALLLHAAFFK
ncbi:hypothetical protein GCM10027359_17370 [Marilutibacter aestuarii]|uniref:Uncharacterized protein n=2 Tax=Marilutibacter aestuarii TaxID=1706195 RepID=A0A507ZXG2_9GAMM|nr:hypothetical protein FKV25_13230 [Lysobacter aestuarii]